MVVVVEVRFDLLLEGGRGGASILSEECLKNVSPETRFIL